MAGRTPEEIRQLLGAPYFEDIRVYRASRIALYGKAREAVTVSECSALIAQCAVEKHGFAPPADGQAK